MLHDSWHTCWNQLHARGDGLALMQQLVSAYEEPQRRYHTLQHLSECLQRWSRHADEMLEPAEVGMALWFHDAIYDVRAQDNEERSAAWAAEALAAAGVAAERVERVRQHILATRHAASPQGADQQWLVDIDLSILSADRARFDEYEAQVRAEYAWVPEPLFRQKRVEVLAGFLARRPLFHTPALRAELEDRARENLARSLARLGGAAECTEGRRSPAPGSSEPVHCAPEAGSP